MMTYGWQGELVRLVPLDSERHLENALQWLSDPEITRWTLVGDLPLTRLAEKEWFDLAEAGSGGDVHFAVETLDGEHIGFSGLHRIEQRHGVAHTGTIIGRTDLWGQGYGGDAARVRTRYAFDVLGLRMLVAEVMAGNEASARMLAGVGYQEVARVPERYWKRGAFRDVLILVCRRPTVGPSSGSG